MRKYKNYILTIIIPLIVILTVLYFKDILLNVENMYVSDLRLQHLPFLNYFKNVVEGKASIFYSFYAGMGNPMLSTIIFYCISPINFLLFVIKDIRYAIMGIYIAKICLAGLAMFILLRKKFDKDNFITVIFAVSYALCSFVINYYYANFWFDSVYLAPIVALGIEKIFDKGKITLLYILPLTLGIICNIQMGFGLCAFSVVYFVYTYFTRYSLKKDFKETKGYIINFIISSLCVGGISSAMILGFMSSYEDIALARSIVIETSTGISNIGYILKNMFSLGHFTDSFFNETEPYIYCGLTVSFFSILYLFNKEIDKRRRNCALGVMIVFILSFSIRFLNTFWHLSLPVMLNYRYSFYLSLFLILFAYECYINKPKLIKKDIVVLTFTLVIAIMVLFAFSNNSYFIQTFIALIVIYTLILLTKNKYHKLEFLLVIAMIAELGYNGYLSIYTAYQLPYSKYSAYTDLLEVANYNDFDDNFRVVYDYSYTDNTNDTFLLNKNTSLRYFSSIVSGNLLKFFENNSSASGNNNYQVSGYDSPLLVSLLGNKYAYYTRDFNCNGMFKKLNEYSVESYDYTEHEMVTKNIYLYENPYALSLGYVIKEDFKHKDGMTLAEYQNGIIKAFTGNDEEIIIPLENEPDDNSPDCVNSGYVGCRKYTVHNNTNNPLIYYYGLMTESNSRGNVTYYLDTSKPIVMSSLNPNVEVFIKHTTDLVNRAYMFTTFNQAALIKNLTQLQENMMENIKINKNKLTGTIDTKIDGIMFLSIPYDKHFKIYLDKKEISYYSLLDNSFIGFDITAGKHDIKLIYEDNRYIKYILASAGSLLITIVLYILINKKVTKRQLEEQRIKEELLQKRLEKKQEKKEKKDKKQSNNKKKRR